MVLRSNVSEAPPACGFAMAIGKQHQVPRRSRAQSAVSVRSGVGRVAFNLLLTEASLKAKP